MTSTSTSDRGVPTGKSSMPSDNSNQDRGTRDNEDYRRTIGAFIETWSPVSFRFGRVLHRLNEISDALYADKLAFSVCMSHDRNCIRVRMSRMKKSAFVFPRLANHRDELQPKKLLRRVKY